MASSLNARLKFLFFTILALVFGAAFLWFWFSLVNLPKESNEDLGETVPGGALILSYALIDEQSDTAALFPALFDFSVGEVTYINTDQEGTVLTGIHHSLSTNGNWLTFIDSENTNGGWPTSLYRVNLQGDDISKNVLAASEAAPVINELRPAFPDISDSGDVLYMSVPETVSLNPENFYANSGATWDITYVNKGGEEKVLTQGAYPQWLGDNDFVFLKGDGVYHYSVNNSEETKLLQSLSLVSPRHRLVLSSDGTMAMLIEPAAGALRLFDVIRSENTVSFNEREPIMTNVTSATFSPNGDHVAVIALPVDSTNSSLIVYDKVGIEVYKASLTDASLALTSLQFWIR